METKTENYGSITVINNFLSKEEHQIVQDYCYSAQYFYGEADNYHKVLEYQYFTGLVHEIFSSKRNNNFSLYTDEIENAICQQVYTIFDDKIKKQFPEMANYKLYRMYVNCFSPNENPYFHIDGETGHTFLYYPQDDWKLDDGGETQFFIDESIHGVLPLPNRIVKFDACIKHKATSFRNRHRFTLAVKYGVDKTQKSE